MPYSKCAIVRSNLEMRWSKCSRRKIQEPKPKPALLSATSWPLPQARLTVDLGGPGPRADPLEVDRTCAESAVSLPRCLFFCGRVTLGRRYYSRSRESSTNQGFSLDWSLHSADRLVPTRIYRSKNRTAGLKRSERARRNQLLRWRRKRPQGLPLYCFSDVQC